MSEPNANAIAANPPDSLYALRAEPATSKKECDVTICTGSQIRAARALLGWSRQVLAEAASLHVNTVVYWEQQEEIPDRGLF